MALLKDSSQKESIRLLHAELWERLEKQDERQAKAFLEQSVLQWRSDHEKQNISENILDFIKSPWLWLSVLTGLLTACLVIFLFVWVALKVE